MSVIQKTTFVPYSPEQMFHLVDDSARYPDFLPWCKHVQILERTREAVTASLTISHGGLTKSFSTRNELFFPNKIVMNLVEGPFKTLCGIWQFNERAANLTEVSLDLQFEFESKLMALAFGKIFSQMANQMVDLFKKRADEVYGGK